ncbi:hypothetical protein [Pseudoxanthomonas dokdonensis]|uniref:Glycine zipper domain-containing protein n=1 Tax=Pseudoxanthomonas dokdonensis TaxID=344882 RepID=A0A0R0CEA0_9GAMM|nr:hypothetical protein [Pseudoxanthomonas dokdonensis]KRG68031.1 hypothetical protein ABB29_14750 [Pseudoxanthomonas dokdonensis]
MAHDNDIPDRNPDPITGAPGSHPLGVGVGGVAGAAAAGAVAGTFFGPIGTLIGAAAGAVAGAAAGKGVAERIDPTTDIDYWRREHETRPYHDASRDFDRDYVSAYDAGRRAREEQPNLRWNDIEPHLHRDWGSLRGASTLDWEDARPAVRDAWDRTDRTHQAYRWSDDYYAGRFERAPYRGDGYTFDDYRPAYRYGTYARHQYVDREWDPDLESELASGWDRIKGESRLSWEHAKDAVADAFTLQHSRPH